MFIYIIFIFAILILVYASAFTKKNRIRSGCRIAALLIIIFFSIFRYDIGFDYQTYFNFIAKNDDSAIIGYEPISYGLMYLARLTDYPPTVFIFFGIPIYIFMYKGFVNSSVNVGFSIIIYISLFYLFSLGAIRQALAMSICIYNYANLRKRNAFAFVVFSIIASLTHYSALISFLVYPVYHRLNFGFLLLGSVMFFILKEAVMSLIIEYTIYGAYLEDLSKISGGQLKQVFYIFLFFSIFLIIKFKSFGDEEVKLLKLTFLSLLFPLFFGTALGDRISNNLYIYFCFLYPLLLKNKFLYKRVFYNVLFISYFLFYVYYTSYGTGNAAPYVPYKTIFTSYGEPFKQYE